MYVKRKTKSRAVARYNMSLTDKTLVFEPNLNAHVMLVYEDRSKLEWIMIINKKDGKTW